MAIAKAPSVTMASNTICTTRVIVALERKVVPGVLPLETDFSSRTGFSGFSFVIAKQMVLTPSKQSS